jgi:hydrogenase-4 component B
MEYFLFGIFLLFAGGFFSLILTERLKSYCVSTAVCISSVFILIPALNVLLSGTTIIISLNLTLPIGEVKLVLDRLSAFFVSMTAVMSSVCTIYSIGYMKHYNNKKRTVTSHFFFLPVLIMSMILVAVVQNAIAFLIVWEIMSLSSFFLLIFENEKDEVVKAGINYLVSMHIGVVFLISAFIILIIKSGSLDFSSFREIFEKERGLVNLLFIFFFVGFGTKAGFIPFHTWLPRAHPAAPSHISGLMSGVMIKTGIYGILRIISLIVEPTAVMAYLVLFISLISGILGVAYAIAQHNLKKLLAYHSVENIGIIGIGIGIGLLGVVYKIPMLAILGFSGGILHVLNHSIFKSMLFYSAGGVYHAAHILEMEKLGGLIKTLAWTAVFFLIGSIAISGLPPFNGFISEFFIYRGLISGLSTDSIPLAVSLIVSFAGLALIGAMALLCFTKAFSVVFLGSPRSEYHGTQKDVSLSMKIAMCVQCLFVLAIGLAPAYAFKIISLVAAEFTGEPVIAEAAAITGTLNNLTTGLLIFVGISGIVFIIRTFLLKNKVSLYKTWDCGYQAGNTRMQYTASSYASPFINLIRPLLYIKERFLLPSGVFPKKADYESHTEDKFDFYIIDPSIRFIERFLDLFKWIQSGDTQQYILYGLVFLIAISLWIMGV